MPQAVVRTRQRHPSFHPDPVFLAVPAAPVLCDLREEVGKRLLNTLRPKPDARLGKKSVIRKLDLERPQRPATLVATPRLPATQCQHSALPDDDRIALSHGRSKAQRPGVI